jgi:hypothetical protein
VVENVSIDYGGVAIAYITEGVYALENYKNNTSLQRTIQVNGKFKLKQMHMAMTYFRLIKRIVLKPTLLPTSVKQKLESCYFNSTSVHFMLIKFNDHMMR